MSKDPEGPFYGLEGAHEYVGLLLDSVREAREEIDADIGVALGEGADRRLEALRLAAYKLERLECHMRSGRRLLNDLRTLRRLMLGERGTGTVEADESVLARTPPRDV